MKWYRVAALVAAALIALGACSQSQIDSTVSNVTSGAAAAGQAATSVAGDIANGDFRVKEAYKFKAVEARSLYYEIGRGSGPMSQGAKVAFENSYEGAARDAIEAQAAGWPQDITSEESVEVVSVTYGDNNATATLTTVETWKVYDESGEELFTETDQQHTVTMRRDMGGLLDSWKVTNIS